jgi:DNA-binding response OmpR family regulator
VRSVPINLSALEYRVIAHLIHERGRVVSQLELSENVHGTAEAHDTNAIEVLIGRLRRKLGIDIIETRRGFGYLIPESVA